MHLYIQSGICGLKLMKNMLVQIVQNNKTGTFREELEPFEYTAISGCILSQPSYDKISQKHTGLI